MSLINATAIHNGASFEIEQSLRFNQGDSAYLSRTPASASNRKTWTFSAWCKKSSLANVSPRAANTLFDAYVDNDNRLRLYFDDTGPLSVYGKIGGSITMRMLTNAFYRDFSAWYHVVLAVDTTQGTNTNRVKLYVNGEQITSFSSLTYPAQNAEHQVNSAISHNIGAGSYSGGVYAGIYLDGYLGEVNFIDGQQLTPTDFGETGTYGEWKPIEYEGTYGTNGFYLPFKQDYTVEGFSTVTWKGNSTNGNYIGGVGFNPDLVWIARTSGADNRVLLDSVRGVNVRTVTNAADAEATEANIIRSFKPDGFTLGSDGYSNYSAANYVAWNWDMGTTTNSKHQISAVGNVKHDSAQYKMGATSIFFDGTGDRLDIPASSLVESSEGTVECWIYMNALVSASQIYYHPPIYHKGDVYQSLNINSAGRVTSYVYTGSANSLESSTSLSTGAWNHVAVTWNSSGRKIWINGVERASSSTSLTAMHTGGNNATFHIGEGTSSSVVSLNAYVDELRVSTTVRYTASFTPYTSALTADNDTTLLLHSDTDNNSTFFVDSSDGGDVNTDGSITSIVAANTTYGQSIVSFTGTGSSATVGHGLNSKPAVVLTKRRDASGHWLINDWSADYVNKLKLNDTEVVSSSNNFVNDASATTFTLGTDTDVNANNGTYIAYCFHDVSGYSKFGNYTGTGSTHAVTLGFAPAFIMLKSIDATHPWVILDNTRQAGTALKYEMYANTQAGEGTDASGVLFTSTGFQLTTDNSYVNQNTKTFVYMAFADKREYAYWLDQSGNNNDWTSNQLTESDIMVDSPTNNFCTMNPLASGEIAEPHATASWTTKEGNLNSRWAGVASAKTMATMAPRSGKWYWEFYIKTRAETARGYVGLGEFEDITYNSEGQNGESNYHIAVGNYSRVQAYGNEFDGVYPVPAQYDVYSIAVDWSGTAGKFWFRINGGAWQGGGNPATGTTPTKSYTKTASGVFNPAMMPYHASGSGSTSNVSEIVFNFGQDSSFAGAKTAQGKQDSGAIGDFHYTPPTDFLAICAKNLPAVDAVPSEHFNTVLYNGSSSTPLSVTGVGFSPDMTWLKARSTGWGTGAFTSLNGTGAGGGYKYMFTNSAVTESDLWGAITFDSDGFTGVSSSYNGSFAHDFGGAGQTFVSWNWKADTTPSKTYAVTVVSDSGNKYRFDGFGTSAVALDCLLYTSDAADE